MSRPSLLIAEPPLQVLPSLAKAIGLNEAIVLQQIQYWIALEQGIEKDGRRWIYNSVEEWRKQFPFWGDNTIQRTLQSLRDKGLIEARKLSSDKWKHTLYYSINYKNLQECITPYWGKGLPENEESITPYCDNGITPSCGDALPHIGVIIPTENTQRLPTETNPEITSFVAQSAPQPKEAGSKQEKTKAQSSTRGTRIPQDFTPSPAMLEWAKVNRPSIDLLEETDKFCDYWRSAAGAKGIKLDWQLTWRTWIRNASGAPQYRQSSYAPKPTMKDKIDDLTRRHGEKYILEVSENRDPLAGIK